MEQYQWLSDEILYNERSCTIHSHCIIFNLHTYNFNAKFHLNVDYLKDLTLLKIEKLLHINIKGLRDYPSMPGFVITYLGTRFIYAKLNYNMIDKHSLFQSNFNSIISKCKKHTYFIFIPKCTCLKIMWSHTI